MMLANYPFMTTIPASDIERARRFYEDKLGLQPNREQGDSLIYEVGGTTFLLYPTSFAGTAQHTLASWIVDNLDALMTELRQRGVEELTFMWDGELQATDDAVEAGSEHVEHRAIAGPRIDGAGRGDRPHAMAGRLAPAAAQAPRT